MSANFWKNLNSQVKAFEKMQNIEGELQIARHAGFIPFVPGNKKTLNLKLKNAKKNYKILENKTGVKIWKFR
jgi:CTP-dependent riboflavin kinase